MMTVEEVRAFAMSLPQAEETLHWGKASFRIKNKIFAVIQEDGVSLVVKTTGEDKMIYPTLDAEFSAFPHLFQN